MMHRTDTAPYRDLPFCSDARFDAVLRFNLFPSADVHPSWLAEIAERCGGIEIPLGNDARHAFWQRTLSMALLEWRQIDQAFDFDFADAGKRLALLPGTTAQALATRLGAVLIGAEIRKWVSGAQVRAVSSALGEPVRHFALRWPDVSEAHTPPEFLSQRLCGACTDAQAWVSVCLGILLGLVPDNAIGVRERLRLKWPRGLRDIKPIGMEETDRTAIARLGEAIAAQLREGAPSEGMAMQPSNDAAKSGT